MEILDAIGACERRYDIFDCDLKFTLYSRTNVPRADLGQMSRTGRAWIQTFGYLHTQCEDVVALVGKRKYTPLTAHLRSITTF